MANKKRSTAPAGDTAPWYAGGLRFRCLPDCGACCSNHDDYAYVYLEEGESERIAEFLDQEPAEFHERYTATDEGHPILRMDDPACPFLSGGRCAVYPVRPLQCRTFPFWEDNLLDRPAWNRLREFCPGIGRGEKQSLPVIQNHLSSWKP